MATLISAITRLVAGRMILNGMLGDERRNRLA